MASILYVSQFYEPENIAPAFRATEHSQIWASMGHDVTVLTGWPNYPMGEVFDGYEVKLLAEKSHSGVRVLRSKLVAKPNTSFISRVENGLSFLWYGLVNLHLNRKTIGDAYDVVFATSGTVFAAILGYRFAKSLKKPFVIEYRDITYSQLAATGTSPLSMKYRGMRWLELMLARKAELVVVLTDTFKATLAEDGIDHRKIYVVPNGAELVALEREEHDGLRLGYFGTMGISQALPEAIDELACLQGEIEPYELLLIGEGAERSTVEETAVKHPFANVMHGMPKSELEAYYARIDMNVVSLKKTDAFWGTLPSKLFQSWARGIPVLFLGPDGEAAELIRKYDLGITLCGSKTESRDQLQRFFGSERWKERLSDMGARAKELMKSKYTRKALAGELLDLLVGVVKKEGAK